jgi:uncharacterized protein YjbJ (UPF0337 family)
MSRWFARARGGNARGGGISRLTPTSKRRVTLQMSIMDKITGRAKKAAGDLADDPSLRRQGSREEAKGEAKDKLDDAQDKVTEKAQEVSDLERKT